MEMVTNYEKFSHAEKYIIGYVCQKMVYMVMVDKISPDFLTVERASRNAGMSLRLRIKAEYRRALLGDSVCLGSADMLTDSKYNRGEMFEKAVTEYYGQKWKKDDIPFWVAGDINLEGVEVQIKLDSATLMSTSLMNKLLAA